jgi:hypothetical protein
LYAFLTSPCVLHALPISSSLILVILQFGEGYKIYGLLIMQFSPVSYFLLKYYKSIFHNLSYSLQI